MAGRMVTGSIIHQTRRDFRADRHGRPTTGAEAATGGRVERTWHFTGHENSLARRLHLGVGQGYRRQQRLAVGMLRFAE